MSAGDTRRRDEAPTIKGWCPGGHRPMMSGDGLVVRVRPWLGALASEQVAALAGLAAQYGNGRIETTTRANLQLRGVTEATLPPLLDSLAKLGMLDDAPEIEGRRNVVLSPFADPRGWDTRALASGLYAGLRDPSFAALPGKFGFAVDPGAHRHLGGISGDIRIEASGPFLLVRADGAAQGLAVRSETDAVACALSLAMWFVDSGGVGPDGRGRMKAHLGRAALPDSLRGDRAPNPLAAPVRPGRIAGGTLLAAAFGQLTPDALRALADAAEGEVRVTPFRMLFLPGVRLDTPPHPDLIGDPDDPLLRAVACTGAPGCPQAHAPVRGLARRLAPRLSDGGLLHVSGCTKGCAHPAPAEVTLVARPGGFDLVSGGTPWDQPDRTGLTLTDAETLLGP